MALHSLIRTKTLCALACSALLLTLPGPPGARAAGSSAPELSSVLSACLRLLDSGQALGGAASLGKLGFRPIASSNPYGGEYAIGPSSRATAALAYEARGAREREQYTFRPALRGYAGIGQGYAAATLWTISPLSHGSDGQGPGFFLMHPERSLSRQELEQLFAEMMRFASSWTDSMIANNVWVCDFAQVNASGGNRLSCYYSMDNQGLFQAHLVLRRGAPVARQPLRDRGPGPLKEHSPDGFLKGVGLF